MLLCGFGYARASSTRHTDYTNPSKPSRVCCTLFLKCSGADKIPKESVRVVYQPNGVMNVVSGRDSFARGICQNPEFVSNF